MSPLDEVASGLWRFTVPRHRALAFGDTVLEVDGELRVWPRHRELRRAWYEQRFLPTLDALTGLAVERVLVSHGEPVLQNGARERGERDTAAVAQVHAVLIAGPGRATALVD